MNTCRRTRRRSETRSAAAPSTPRPARAAMAGGGGGGGEGSGGSKARSIVHSSYLALASDQHLRTTVIAGRSDLGMPDWRGQIAGRALSPAEISDVVAWLVTKRTPVPGRPGGS